MNTSLPIESTTVGAAKPSGPLELDMETLKQVAGGSTVIGDPGWLTAPGGKPPSVVVIIDPV
jgi:hypothetical protein